MSTLITAQRRSVNFIAVGGTGCNILRGYDENHPKHASLLADERHVYVDTSLSNLVGVDSGKVFHLKRPDGTPFDGAGGERKSVAAAFKAALPEIFSRFEPAEKNYFVGSLSGGSGPTGIQIMIEHLHRLGHHAAMVAVSSCESANRIQNVINTFTGFEGVVGRTGRPIVISLHENNETLSHVENNVAPQFDLAALSILSSGLNEGMDSADSNNVFDYQNVTHHAPGVALMRITVDADKLKDLKGPLLSYATVARSRDERIPKLAADSDTVGYMRDQEGEGYENSFYFGVSQAAAADLFKDLIKQRNDLETQKQVKTPVVSLLSGAAMADDLGIY